MNDTETEARHLLAAATEDMPPGIGLLDGFAAARQRDRARRTRRGAVLSAGIAAAAASVTALTLTVGSAPPALATVTSALTRTLTQSYHLTQHVSTYYLWNGRVHLPGHDTCTSVADPVRHLEAASCSDLVNGGASREVGRYTYSYSIVPTRGRHWQRIPTACLSHQPPAINGFTAAKPQQMLAEIKQAAKVTVVGPASEPGWTGTRYAFSGNAGTRTKFSGTVTVDQQGRARALILTIRSASAVNVFVMTQNLAFSDFGASVTVTPPPADQTFSSPC